MTNLERINNIQIKGKIARGQKELIKHLRGNKLTLRQAVNAQCYDCSGFFCDGKVDCCLPHCPLYPFMFYNEKKAKKKTTKRKSDEHMQKMRSSIRK
jgi:hypothetical protein